MSRERCILSDIKHCQGRSSSELTLLRRYPEIGFDPGSVRLHLVCRGSDGTQFIAFIYKSMLGYCSFSQLSSLFLRY
jgi:hypothetical protein